MKPSRDLQLVRLLLADADVMIDVLADQVAQHGEEIRHRLTSARFTALHTADRDALLGHGARLLHQLCEAATPQVRRPPQTHRRGDRRVNVIGAEDQSSTPHGRLDLRVIARSAFALPLTHIRNGTPEGEAEPLPQTPTQRPTGARVS